MGRKTAFIALLVSLLAFSGCREIFTSPDGLDSRESRLYVEESLSGKTRDSFLYLDEKIVLQASEFLSPIDEIPVGEEMEFVFDVSQIVKVLKAGSKDVELFYIIRYPEKSQRVTVYNVETASWDVIAVLGFDALPVDGDLFSAHGFEASHYIDDENRIRVRGDLGVCKLRDIKLNPRYAQVPVPELDDALEPTLMNDGLAFDGEAFWMLSRYLNVIYRISPSGEILDSFDSPRDRPYSIAYDGENLWIGYYDLIVASIDTEGNLLCQFAVTEADPSAGPFYLACADGKLWGVQRAKVAPDYTHHFYRIDPEGSCEAGEAIVEGGFVSDRPYTVIDFDWNGCTLWVLSDSLYEYSTDGACVAAYGTDTIKEEFGLAFDGDAFYLAHEGPDELTARDDVISRFTVR